MFSKVSVSHSVHGWGGLHPEGRGRVGQTPQVCLKGGGLPNLPVVTSSVAATATVSTHPTGMRSCFIIQNFNSCEIWNAPRCRFHITSFIK